MFLCLYVVLLVCGWVLWFCACLCVYGCRLCLCVWCVVLVCGLDCVVGV